MTALASIDRISAQHVTQIVFVTVTGVAVRQIEFMARRAKQLFPVAKIQFLDLTKTAGAIGQSGSRAEGLTTFSVISDFVSANVAETDSPPSSFKLAEVAGPRAGAAGATI